jgi:hypothetical protein
MENLGYVLWEALVFFLVSWFAVRLVQYRRYWRNQPVFTDQDQQLLFRGAKANLAWPVLRLRMARAILAVTAAMYVEFLVFAPFGAGILAGIILLTSAAIVQTLMFDA